MDKAANSDGILSLKWNRHKTTFFSVLTALKLKGVFSDVSVVCGAHVFPAHKVVLAVSSPYFQHILSQLPDLRHHQPVVIVLQDVLAEDFSVLLDYMYLGEASVHEEKLARLLQVSEKLKIRGLSGQDSDEDIKNDNEGMAYLEHSKTLPMLRTSRSAQQDKKRKANEDDICVGEKKIRKIADEPNYNKRQTEAEDDSLFKELHTNLLPEPLISMMDTITTTAAATAVAATTTTAGGKSSNMNTKLDTTERLRTSSQSKAPVNDDGLCIMIKMEETEEADSAAAATDGAVWPGLEEDKMSVAKSSSCVVPGRYYGVLLPDLSTKCVRGAWLTDVSPDGAAAVCLLPPDGVEWRDAVPGGDWARHPVTVMVSAKTSRRCKKKLGYTKFGGGSDNTDNVMSASSGSEGGSDEEGAERVLGGVTAVLGDDDLHSSQGDGHGEDITQKLGALRSELDSLKMVLAGLTGAEANQCNQRSYTKQTGEFTSQHQSAMTTTTAAATATSDASFGLDTIYSPPPSYQSPSGHHNESAPPAYRHQSTPIYHNLSTPVNVKPVNIPHQELLYSDAGTSKVCSPEVLSDLLVNFNKLIDESTDDKRNLKNARRDANKIIEILKDNFTAGAASSPLLPRQCTGPPANTLEELDHLVKSTAFVKELREIRGVHLKDTTRRMMKRMLSDSLVGGISYSGLGCRRQHTKIAFKNLHACTCLLDALDAVGYNDDIKIKILNIQDILRHSGDWTRNNKQQRRDGSAPTDHPGEDPCVAAAAAAAAAGISIIDSFHNPYHEGLQE